MATPKCNQIEIYREKSRSENTKSYLPKKKTKINRKYKKINIWFGHVTSQQGGTPMSLINNVNKIGPRWKPFGTPDDTFI